MIQALCHQFAHSRPERDLPSAACVPKAGCRRPDQSDSSEITVFPALKAKSATAEFAADTQSFALFAIDLKPTDVEMKAPNSDAIWRSSLHPSRNQLTPFQRKLFFTNYNIPKAAIDTAVKSR
jgi:hypothetical protein